VVADEDTVSAVLGLSQYADIRLNQLIVRFMAILSRYGASAVLLCLSLSLSLSLRFYRVLPMRLREWRTGTDDSYRTIHPAAVTGGSSRCTREGSRCHRHGPLRIPRKSDHTDGDGRSQRSRRDFSGQCVKAVDFLYRVIHEVQEADSWKRWRGLASRE
jgi:hypothetical protein